MIVPSNRVKEGCCEMCERERELTFHHLIPKTCHSSKWFKKNFTKEDMTSRGINVCRDCHIAIHKFIPEKELGRIFNTQEKLMENDQVKNFVEWVSKR